MDSLIALLGLLLTAAPQVTHPPSQETLQIRGSDIDDRSKYIATCRMYFETFDIDHRGYLTKRGLRRIISNSVLVEVKANVDAARWTPDRGRLSPSHTGLTPPLETA